MSKLLFVQNYNMNKCNYLGGVLILWQLINKYQNFGLNFEVENNFFISLVIIIKEKYISYSNITLYIPKSRINHR